MAGMTYKKIEPSDIFECKTCGECCKGYGGTYVSEEDISNIAEYIHVTIDVLKPDTLKCHLQANMSSYADQTANAFLQINSALYTL